jgi:hypothetical protein
MRIDRSCILTAVIVAAAGNAALAGAVNVYYDSATGNLRLQNTSPDPVKLRSYDILTLGNGDVGEATPTNEGYLTGPDANVPSPAPQFTTSNTEEFGVNGKYSQIYAANVNTTPVLTLAGYVGWSPGSPLGPAGSFFDLGNVAALGMTQDDLDARFITVPEISPGEVMGFGKFLFDYEITAGDFSGAVFGNVIAFVPEPSTLLLATVMLGCAAARRLVGRYPRC